MGVSVLMWAATGVLAVGVILHIVGLATPEWETFNAYGQKSTIGLWEFCKSGQCFSLGAIKPSKLEACEAMAILGMLASFVSLGAALVFVVFDLMGKGTIKMLPLVSLLTGCLACALIIAAVIIWGASYHTEGTDFGYSFALSIVGAILILIGCILAFVAGRI